MTLPHDILLDNTAFVTASTGMSNLETRTKALREKLDSMYKELATALDTPAGRQVEFTAGDVLIQPIDDMSEVIRHISATMTEIIGTNHYNGIFIKFAQLNQSINF